MVTIEEIQTAYYMVAATGVLVAAAYYILNVRATQRNLRMTLETRQADILQRHAQMYSSKEFMDAWWDVVMNQHYLTYEEWLKYYGPTVNREAYVDHTVLVQYYECLGGLLRQNLASIELVEKIWQPLHLVCVWDRVEPVIKGWRERYKDDSIYENLEFLFNRYMKRHPKMGLTRSARHEQMVANHDEWIRSLESK